MQVVKYVFQPHGDERGQLVALEEYKDIPFRIKRVYYMKQWKDLSEESMLTKISNRFWYAFMDPSRLNWIMVKVRRRSYLWKNHMKVYT